MTDAGGSHAPTGYAVTFRVETATTIKRAAEFAQPDGKPMTIGEIQAHEEEHAIEALERLLAEGKATIHAEVAPVYGDAISNHQDFDSPG